MRRILVVVLLGSLPACSFLSASTRGTSPPCKTDVATPLVDTTVTAIALAVCTWGVVFQATHGVGEAGLPASITCIPSAPFALTYGASAIYGFHRSATCS